MPAGIYIHIPFCARKCPYCDFYSVAPERALIESYLCALEREAYAFPAKRADTLYFGGGTPSLLGAGDIARLIELARGRFSLADGAEITLECNPATADFNKLRAFREAGVNRLSVGVQSLDNGVLRAAGRLHTAREALETLADANRAGFDNVSADIMIGLPRETGAQLDKTVEALCGAGVEHISAYMLKIMEGTPFAERAPDGLPGDDEAAALYERCCDALASRGLEQYEISNFALAPRYESRHNKKYWELGEWIGLGAAAHSCFDGGRWSFTRDINSFISAFGAGGETGGTGGAGGETGGTGGAGGETDGTGGAGGETDGTGGAGGETCGTGGARGINGAAKGSGSKTDREDGANGAARGGFAASSATGGSNAPENLAAASAACPNGKNAETDYRSALDFEGAPDGGDYIMLRLRTREGLSLSKLNELYNISMNQRQVDFIEELVSGSLARFDGETLALTRRGLLVSNSIIARLI